MGGKFEFVLAYRTLEEDDRCDGFVGHLEGENERRDTDDGEPRRRRREVERKDVGDLTTGKADRRHGGNPDGGHR